MAVAEGLVREEQLLHDLCLLGAVTVEITQILTRAGYYWLKYIWTPLKIEPGLVMWWSVDQQKKYDKGRLYFSFLHWFFVHEFTPLKTLQI